LDLEPTEVGQTLLSIQVSCTRANRTAVDLRQGDVRPIANYPNVPGCSEPHARLRSGCGKIAPEASQSRPRGANIVRRRRACRFGHWLDFFVVLVMLSNCVLIPVISFLLGKIFPLTPDESVGILLLAVIPGTPIALQFTRMAKTRLAFAAVMTFVLSLGASR